MILWAFLLFSVASVFFILLGQYTNEQEVILMGAFLLFVPAWALFGVNIPLINAEGGIQYADGYNVSLSFNESYKYGNNFTGYHWDYVSPSPSCPSPNDPACAWLFHRYRTENEIKEVNYSTYSNRAIGLILLFFATVVFILAIMDIRGTPDSEGPKSVWRRWR